MRRLLMTVALAGSGIAAPALAEKMPGYDDKLLTACIAQSKASGTDADSCIGTASTKCMEMPGARVPLAWSIVSAPRRRNGTR